MIPFPGDIFLGALPYFLDLLPVAKINKQTKTKPKGMKRVKISFKTQMAVEVYGHKCDPDCASEFIIGLYFLFILSVLLEEKRSFFPQ